MHVKKGDNVIVLTGKDKGKTGKILKAFPRENLVLVDGVNMKKVHERAKKRDTKGTIIEKIFPIHVSNVKKSGESKTKTKTKVKTVSKPKAKNLN